MTERDQLAHVCRWNRQLDRENRRLREQVTSARREVGELETALARMQVEADATDALLGVAMEQAIGRAP